MHLTISLDTMNILTLGTACTNAQSCRSSHHKQSNTLYYQISIVQLHRSCILQYYKMEDVVIL